MKDMSKACKEINIELELAFAKNHLGDGSSGDSDDSDASDKSADKGMDLDGMDDEL
jgi:hypothetical protein